MVNAPTMIAKCHTNKDIDSTKTHLNYYIKKNNYTYTKEFDKLRKEQNLAGYLRENSIIMCQMIFTSDQDKKVTNYAKTKEILKTTTLELLNTSELQDIKKLVLNRDKIIEE